MCVRVERVAAAVFTSNANGRCDLSHERLQGRAKIVVCIDLCSLQRAVRRTIARPESSTRTAAVSVVDRAICESFICGLFV